MSVHHANAAKTIARAATQVGAVLPEQIADALDHLEQIIRTAPAPAQPGAIAADLAAHIGTPAAMDKALKAAATDLASAEATAKIRAHLAETCGTRIRRMMHQSAEQIATAFGDALADDLATLTDTAGQLPAWFNPSQAGDLDAAAFTAWTQARAAHARITAASTALAPLYGAAIPHGNGTQFTAPAAAALRFSKPPRLTTPLDAYAYRDALAGRTARTQYTAGQGSVYVDGIFAPTLLAHIGATFEWATPAQVTQRAAFVVDGMVLKPEPVSTPAATSVVAF